MIEGIPIHPCGSWHKFPSPQPGPLQCDFSAFPTMTQRHPPPWLWENASPVRLYQFCGLVSRNFPGFLSLCISLGTLPLPMNKPGLTCWWDRDRVLVTIANHQTHPRSKAARPVGCWSQTHKGPQQSSQELPRGAESKQKNKLNT